MPNEPDAPKLQPPGAGLPFLHTLFLRRWFLPRYLRRRDWAAREAIFRRHGERLVELCRSQPHDLLHRRALVGPMVGLEDSSRYWSVAMVVEHLLIVGGLQSRLIRELSFGRVPVENASIASVKPKGALDVDELLPRFIAFLDEFDALVDSGLGDRRSPARFPHPWFGPLTAEGWHGVAALHQGLHRRQAEAILRALVPAL
jgi:hypothetical protein